MRSLWILLLVLFGFGTGSMASAADNAVQKRFSIEMARGLLGSQSQFVPLGDGHGTRGFLLAEIGSTATPISEAYSGVQGEFTQALADAIVFDKPVVAVDGVAVLTGDSLAGAWRDILDHSRPGFSITKDRALDERTMKWLFKPNKGQTDPKKKYSRERSSYYKKYQEFEKKYSLLLAAQQGEVWRSIPGFSSFKSFEAAERNLLNEWFKSGYKAEIDSAMWRFSSTVPFVEWQAWAEANAKFESNMVPYAQFLNLPVTRLFPPPASWSSVSMWFRGVSRDASGGGQYQFQFARVRIARPWMDLDALLLGKIKFSQDKERPFMVSGGELPSETSLPSGVLGAFIEELVLVRNVTKIGTVDNVQDGHPLGLFAYPDAINLLGYVVRTLPALPGREVEASATNTP
jgi:hypothetical protein